MIRALPIAAALVLSACASNPIHVDAPVDLPKVLTEDRVITIGCITRDQIPPRPAPVGAQMTGDAAHDAELLAAARLADLAWQERAIALLEACVLR